MNFAIRIVITPIIELFRIILSSTRLKTSYFSKDDAVNDIEITIIIPKGGHLTTNTGDRKRVEAGWWFSRRFIIKRNTTIVTIRADDTKNANGAWNLLLLVMA